MPANYQCPKCGGKHFRKETDTMDVWFDSGSSHFAVLENKDRWPELSWPADLYLEGSDQHRGWFQSSLLTSVGAYGVPPYKSVMHCGFTVDEQGRKMSKSLGNGVDPAEVMEKYGADVLRLWVSSVDYSQDVSISDSILKQVSDAYRRFRNTFRFLLANVDDFDFERDGVKDWNALEPIDKHMMVKLANVLGDIEAAYASYKFNSVYRIAYDFVNDLSAVYMDVTKDRLYSEAPDSIRRRAAQTVLMNILEVLVRVMSPILSFTCDEVWEHYPESERFKEGRPFSVQLAGWPSLADFTPAVVRDDAALAAFDSVLALREVVTKALEDARSAKKINKSQEARVVVYAQPEVCRAAGSFDAGVFEELFIVSGVEFAELVDGSEEHVEVLAAEGEKCPRCWNFRELGGNAAHPAVCKRCGDALDALGFTEE